ncbi:MAG: ABC transporter ATP-binding protein [Chitinophagaceae bacterium]|nr:ABC transporter ATP-binding protein [Chitinophagaceae bacterium]
MKEALLSINNLSVTFTNDGQVTRAIDRISIEVNKGELVAIVGESGSGKSVTSLSILQLLPKAVADYASGQIVFTRQSGETINLVNADDAMLRKIRGKEIAMIFQEPMTSLNPVFTCGNQVMEAVLLHENISRRQAKKKTITLFEKVQLPAPALIFNRYPHQLSGGQKQRVMIAMAISCHPSLLICDEPTTALDVTVQKTILGLVKDLQQQQNMGVIFISHDLNVVAEIADRVIVMYKGKIVEQGLAKDIYHQPRHPYTKALLACRPLLHSKDERLPVVSDFMATDENGNIQEIDRSLQKVPPIHSGATAHTTLLQPISTKQKTLIKVENLQVWFPSKKTFLGNPLEFTKAVNDVSFTVYEGETLGLVGESGCGKTTVGRALLRLIQPKGGKVFFKETEILSADRKTLQVLRKNMQIIFQDPYSSLNPRMTIGKAITEPLTVHKIGASARDRKERVMDLLEKVSLNPQHYNRYPHEFSGGQRQRIVIARALALQPSFIICDESVSALDVSVQAQVLNLLNDLKKEFGFTAIFISHDLSVVRYISDRIMVMSKGEIVETGESEQIYNHPGSVYTQQLIASIPKGLVA